MKLTNSMEQAVRGSLKLMRAQASAPGSTCWCPLCRADMLALALNSLPTRYMTRRQADTTFEAPAAAAIHDGVVAARLQVARTPRHEQGAAATAAEPVWVVNFPLEEGFRAVDAIMNRQDNTCGCWNCRCDAVAIALNRYPAHYGVEYRGRITLQEEDRARIRHELSTLLELAVKLVGSVPRHDFRPAA